MQTIRRVAVLGAGTMGAGIAAHFANAGTPVLLLDLPASGQTERNAIARAGLDAAAKRRPGAFFTPQTAALITCGNFEDDLPKLRDCDWILEAVVEQLDVKRQLLARVREHRRPGAILTTNTSGIPLRLIAEGFDGDTLRHFAGTHFFNPPRYLHLLELIPGPGVAPEVLALLRDFCDRRLGKGVVGCKDTPNFIANRIGSFYGATVHLLTVEGGYTVEEVDFLTGPLVGLPRSATYRLMDIVGLDVWAHVTRNLYDAVPHDPWRERFVLPPFLSRMIERGLLGEKRGQGFYKVEGKGESKQILAIDWQTLEYGPQKPVRFPAIETARLIEDLPGRLRALTASSDRAGSFVWRLLRDHCLYAASMVPEISDRIVEIDQAMRWGYAHKLGPFETWDALGFAETARRMERDGLALPPAVERMLAAGAESFYRAADQAGQPRTEYFDLAGSGAYALLAPRPGILSLPEIKRARGVVRRNAGASLVDLDDGVLCVEFHSKMNTIGEDFLVMLHAGLEETSRGFAAMVIANQGENFSAGANLTWLLVAAQDGDWEEIDLAVRRFQQVNLALQRAAKPVVAAPFGLALGGGAEVALHAARIQASAELYMGLVELGAGLIPAGGGCKEMLRRAASAKAAFETIGLGKTSSSAEDARRLGFLRPQDGVSMNPERLPGDAKALALALARDYQPPAPAPVRVEGAPGYALLKMGVFLAREAGQISDYDALLGDKLAFVLSGGRLSGPQEVPEEYLLDLEREAFLSLCGNAKTHERMQHLLKTGKPLRN